MTDDWVESSILIANQMKKDLKGTKYTFHRGSPFVDEIENKFKELAGELAPDPLNIDRLRLNRLLHQTPDLPEKS